MIWELTRFGEGEGWGGVGASVAWLFVCNVLFYSTDTECPPKINSIFS